MIKKSDACPYPGLKECKTNGGGDEETIDSEFNSGYNHGCSDAKISNPDKRYIKTNREWDLPNIHPIS
ncbi:hypothetical protein BH23THE1_BH23THE1_23820 [soil metagenome]